MKFKFQSLDIPEVLLITHDIVIDGRGFFLESFREDQFHKANMPKFIQDNHAVSNKSVLRGLHYQLQPAAIGKLIRCINGCVFDVAVDIRKGSPTYKKWVGMELSQDDPFMIFIPEGFAHGYCALSDASEVIYKTTGYYAPDFDRNIRWDDPDIGIKWPISNPDLSEKDRNAPFLNKAENNFNYSK